MGYGNGNKPVAESGRRVVKFKSLYKKAFSTFYTNAASTSGNCKVTCSALNLSTLDGTLTYKKGFPNIKFISDDGAKTVYFSLRNKTAETTSRGVHLLTFSNGRAV